MFKNTQTCNCIIHVLNHFCVETFYTDREYKQCDPGKVRTCIVSKCKVDHPPWVCEHFKELPVISKLPKLPN